MSKQTTPQYRHFTLEPLADGVYACIHRPGGLAYSNAGILDLGDQTLVVDAFQIGAAAHELRAAAEAIFGRPVAHLALTHAHPDHWIGLPAFDTQTTVFTSEGVNQACLDWGPKVEADFQDPAEWVDWRGEVVEQLQRETDPDQRAALEGNLAFINAALAEIPSFQLRYPDLTFAESLTLQGEKRLVEVRSLGRGHSEDDTVVLLPGEGIAFIGDIGFFDSQPFFGFCDFELYRAQLRFFQESDYRVLVPGHGPVGGQEDITLSLDYFDEMETQVGEVVQQGGGLEEALAIKLPELFEHWRRAGRERFEVNVRFLWERLGGEEE
jgi:glyoxylase-like metal-dependent hydrolase (beta-lactamase superfamily II)